MLLTGLTLTVDIRKAALQIISTESHCRHWRRKSLGQVRSVNGLPSMAAIRRSNRMILGAGHPPFVFARVATGGIRHRPMVGRSGAERADCPAVLTGRAHRATHCVRFALCVQTGAMRMTTKRAARAALPAALLGAPQWACAGYRLPRRWAFGVPCTEVQSPEPGATWRCANQRPGCEGPWGPCAARLCGAEERRACARAQRVRHHSHRACLNAEPAGRAVSCAMRAQDRAPQGSRRVQRPTATVKCSAGAPRAFAARKPPCRAGNGLHITDSPGPV